MTPLTTLGDPTIVFKSVFGNKRIVVATLTFGDGSLTWPSGGLAFSPSSVGMTAFEYVAISGDGQQFYIYNYTTGYIDAYVAATTTGADKVLTAADGTAPADGTIRIFCIGYGAF